MRLLSEKNRITVIIFIDRLSNIYNFVPTDNITMDEKGKKNIARKGGSDKRGITVILSETLSSELLPFQLIYKGKTARSLPQTTFPDGFYFVFQQKSLEQRNCNH